ncbi:MAG: hypothetical protein AVDCRST_MAG80-360, partial [uncultured Rubrobacteraceae bacterium]
EREHRPPTRARRPAGRRRPGRLARCVFSRASVHGRGSLSRDPGRGGPSSRLPPIRHRRRPQPSSTRLGALSPPAQSPRACIRPLGRLPGGCLGEVHTPV